MSRCSENIKISNETWDFMNFVRDVGEESITDYLVWQWRKLNNRFNFLNVDKHTRFKENTESGADFELELWIVTRSQSLSFVFQAKKLVEEFNSYRSKLNYKNGALRQIDVLKKFAQDNKKLPFYLFYSQPNTDTVTRCPRNRIDNTALFMTDAYTVDNLITEFDGHSLSKNTILSTTNPFHCLFCCPLAQGNLLKYIDRYFPEIFQENIQFDSNELPTYVELILNNELENIDEIISQNNLSVFRNIGVLDLRNEKYE